MNTEISCKKEKEFSKNLFSSILKRTNENYIKDFDKHFKKNIDYILFKEENNREEINYKDILFYIDEKNYFRRQYNLKEIARRIYEYSLYYKKFGEYKVNIYQNEEKNKIMFKNKKRKYRHYKSMKMLKEKKEETMQKQEKSILKDLEYKEKFIDELKMGESIEKDKIKWEKCFENYFIDNFLDLRFFKEEHDIYNPDFSSEIEKTYDSNFCNIDNIKNNFSLKEKEFFLCQDKKKNLEMDAIKEKELNKNQDLEKYEIIFSDNIQNTNFNLKEYSIFLNKKTLQKLNLSKSDNNSFFSNIELTDFSLFTIITDFDNLEESKISLKEISSISFNLSDFFKEKFDLKKKIKNLHLKETDVNSKSNENLRKSLNSKNYILEHSFVVNPLLNKRKFFTKNLQKNETKEKTTKKKISCRKNNKNTLSNNQKIKNTLNHLTDKFVSENYETQENQYFKNDKNKKKKRKKLIVKIKDFKLPTFTSFSLKNKTLKISSMLSKNSIDKNNQPIQKTTNEPLIKKKNLHTIKGKIENLVPFLKNSLTNKDENLNSNQNNLKKKDKIMPNLSEKLVKKIDLITLDKKNIKLKKKNGIRKLERKKSEGDFRLFFKNNGVNINEEIKDNLNDDYNFYHKRNVKSLYCLEKQLCEINLDIQNLFNL